MANYYNTNKSARIRSRVTRNKKLRTETRGRESGPDMAISTDARTGRTRLFIDIDGVAFGPDRSDQSVELSGSEARTLFRLLAKHYGYTGKSFEPVGSVVTA